MWGMPVATSYKGKSAIAETHPLSLGMVGVYGQDVANSVVGDADTVLVVGAKLTPQDTVRQRPDIFDPHRNGSFKSTSTIAMLAGASRWRWGS